MKLRHCLRPRQLTGSDSICTFLGELLPRFELSLPPGDCAEERGKILLLRYCEVEDSRARLVSRKSRGWNITGKMCKAIWQAIPSRAQGLYDYCFFVRLPGLLCSWIHQRRIGTIIDLQGHISFAGSWTKLQSSDWGWKYPVLCRIGSMAFKLVSSSTTLLSVVLTNISLEFFANFKGVFVYLSCIVFSVFSE